MQDKLRQQKIKRSLDDTPLAVEIFFVAMLLSASIGCLGGSVAFAVWALRLSGAIHP